MTINEKVSLALGKHDAAVRVCESYKNDESKEFIINQVRYVANTVLHLAREIRGNVKLRSWQRHGRAPDNVLNEMLTWGQPLTSFLWLANLRDTIVDPIEHTYGVSFSSLAIYPEWVDTTDNATVYALYYHPEYNRGDSMTLAKHGEVYFGKNSEYGTRYIKKEYN